MAMHTLKHCGVNTVRSLNYLWPISNILHATVKMADSQSSYSKIQKDWLLFIVADR